MGVGKSNIEYHSKREKNILLMNPRFLSDDDLDAINKFVEYLEGQVDKPKSDYFPSTVLKLFSSVRLARGIEHVLLRDYYSFVSQSLEQVLDKKDLNRLVAKGIDEPYKLRLLAINKVNKQNNGFVNEDGKKRILTTISSELNVDIASVEKGLWLDAEDMKIMSKMTDPTPSSTELIPILNFHILDSLLRYSTIITLWIEGEFNGTVAKKLFWMCKKSGIYCEFIKIDNKLQLEISGPEELIGKKEKYGRLLAPIFFNLAVYLQEINRSFSFEVDLFLFSRERVFRGTADIVKRINIPTDRARQFLEYASEFDSNVEKKFFLEFNSERSDRKGWALTVEPEIIISGSTIFIPDFALSRNGQQIFLEIIGFWTEAYKSKKLAKLVELKKNGMKNLILLVDTNLRTEFTEITTGYPVIYYSKRFPIHIILEILETQFSNFENRKGQILQQLDKITNEVSIYLRGSQNIELKTLYQIFGCYNEGELKRLVSTDMVRTRFKQEELEFIDGIGILRINVLNQLKSSIQQNIPQTGSLLSDIDQLIRNEGFKYEDLIPLLRKFNYQVVWKALDTPRVILAD